MSSNGSEQRRGSQPEQASPSRATGERTGRKAAPKSRLGRGLDALLPASPAPPRQQPFRTPSNSPNPPGPSLSGTTSAETGKAERATSGPARANLGELPIESIRPNASQPRAQFSSEALQELTESIREYGVLEPILVRKKGPDSFEIVAGERRWRAAQRAGLKSIPATIHELSDKKTFEIALVENLQREDLNPVEVAKGLSRLIEEHSHTQESAAKVVGKDRSTVANALRLLKLPEDVLKAIEAGELSEGHGRAILGAGSAPAMSKLARLARDAGLSVRETERKARAASGKKSGEGKNVKSANVRSLEARLSTALGTRVTVEDKNGKGHIALHYANYDMLDAILSKLT